MLVNILLKKSRTTTDFLHLYNTLCSNKNFILITSRFQV